MNYLLEVERPVFLHFLNREAEIAIGKLRPEAGDLHIIETLLITHISRMSVNISQMLEYSHEKRSLVNIISLLVANDILVTTSHDANIREFLTSRQSMYANVSHKYPMYFKDTGVTESIKIVQTNKFSMTRALRRDILDLDEVALNLNARRSLEIDRKRFRENIGIIQNIVYSHPEEAITRANIEVFSSGENRLPPPVLDSSARMFSALYNEHYAEFNGVATCSGLNEAGFEDDLRRFPHYDFPVLVAALASLGWLKLRQSLQDPWMAMIGVYGTDEHRIFVEHLHAFLFACVTQARASFKADNPPIEALRGAVINVARSLLRNATAAVRRPQVDLKHFFLEATEAVCRAAVDQGSRNSVFLEAWRTNVPKKSSIRVALTTAADVEDDVLAKAIQTSGYSYAGVIPVGESYARRYFRGDREELLHFRTSAGSVGSSGSELTSTDAIRGLNIKFLISVGICFGLKKKKQHVGDVLISSEVVDYEIVRVEPDDGIRERGPRIPSGSKLLSAARTVRTIKSGASFTVRIGQFLSGLKLVDSRAEVEALSRRFPDAVGADMEASGIMAAATRYKLEGIVVKGICDWGYQKKDEHQVVAAGNAAEIAMQIAGLVFEAELQRTD